LAALPSARDREQQAHTPRSARLLLACLRRLRNELLDEQIGHAGFEIVEQALDRRLLDLAARQPFLACTPCTSTCEESTLPPTFVTASATRCSSAAPATVSVCPSRKGEPVGIEPAATPGPAPGAPGLRPSSWTSRSDAAATAARCSKMPVTDVMARISSKTTAAT
jgi:hypothetical protein